VLQVSTEEETGMYRSTIDSLRAQLAMAEERARGMEGEVAALRATSATVTSHMEQEEALFRKLLLAETKASSARIEVEAVQKQRIREGEEHDTQCSGLQMRIMQLEEAQENTHKVGVELKASMSKSVQLEADVRRSAAEVEASQVYYHKSVELEGEVAELRRELQLARDQWHAMEVSVQERDVSIVGLREALVDTQDLQLRLDQVTVTLVESTSQVETLQCVIETMRERETESQTRLLEAQNANGSLQHQLECLSEMEQTTLVTKEEALKRAKNAEENAVHSYHLLKEGHDKTKSMFDRTLETLAAERADHALQLEELQTQLQQDHSYMEELKKQLQDSRLQVNEFQHQSKVHASAEASYKHKIIELEAFRQRNLAEKEAMQAALTGAEAGLKAEKLAREEAMAAMEASRQQTNQMYAQTESTLSAERESRHSEVTMLEAEIARLRQDLQESMLQLSHVRSDDRQQMDQTNQMYAHTESTLSAERESRHSEVTMLEAEIARLRQDLQKSMLQLSHVRSDDRQQMDQMRDVQQFSYDYVSLLRKRVADLKFKLCHHPALTRCVVLWWRCVTTCSQLRSTQRDLDEANATIHLVQERRQADLDAAEKELAALRKKRLTGLLAMKTEKKATPNPNVSLGEGAPSSHMEVFASPVSVAEPSADELAYYKMNRASAADEFYVQHDETFDVPEPDLKNLDLTEHERMMADIGSYLSSPKGGDKGNDFDF